MCSASYFSKILLLILLVPISCVSTSGSIDKTAERDTYSAESEYSVDFYPAYGYKQEDIWVIPATAYVYEYRGYLENLIISLSQIVHQFEPEESEIFRNRLRAFTADSESRETVTFVFDNDVEREEYTIMNNQVTFNQKLSNIKTIIDHFPEREFILVGDSGQHDR